MRPGSRAAARRRSSVRGGRSAGRRPRRRHRRGSPRPPPRRTRTPRARARRRRAPGERELALPAPLAAPPAATQPLLRPRGESKHVRRVAGWPARQPKNGSGVDGTATPSPARECLATPLLLAWRRRWRLGRAHFLRRRYRRYRPDEVDNRLLAYLPDARGDEIDGDPGRRVRDQEDRDQREDAGEHVALHVAPGCLGRWREQDQREGPGYSEHHQGNRLGAGRVLGEVIDEQPARVARVDQLV